MEKFIDDDEGYLEWLERNPDGFVVNSHREPISRYLILHKATCGTISSPNRKNWTTGDYIKFCSSDRSELEEWALDAFNTDLWACRKCKP